MKIFLIGLPKSGRSTIAKALVERFGAHYIDAMQNIKSSFRTKKTGEHPHSYDDEYERFLSVRRACNPLLVISDIKDFLSNPINNGLVIIDAITSPKDFVELFDYRNDIVVFLNRTDADAEFKDHENIGVSVIRDYCFWLASTNLINRNKWLEYNFKIPGEPSDFIKELGSKNSVFIIRSIDKVIEHLSNCIKPFILEG